MKELFLPHRKMVGEKMILDTDQSVFSRTSTIFTKSVKCETSWPVCVLFRCPNSTELSYWQSEDELFKNELHAAFHWLSNNLLSRASPI